MRLESAAPAKINLCLYLGPVRDDGRHELVTVMQSISLCDRVTLEQLPQGSGDEVVCPGVDPAENLITRAIDGLRLHGTVPPVRVVVEKRIPVAAGLAGGSADAAATLRLLQQLAAFDDEVLGDVATGLGADVPAQIAPGRSLATGAGEVVERLPDTARYDILVLPDAGLPTAEVFREADRLGLPRDARSLDRIGASVRAAASDLPGELCVNELEPATLALRPAVADRLERLAQAGADVVLVSGSGPTTFGLFADDKAARAAAELFEEAVLAEPVGATFAEVRSG